MNGNPTPITGIVTLTPCQYNLHSGPGTKLWGLEQDCLWTTFRTDILYSESGCRLLTHTSKSETLEIHYWPKVQSLLFTNSNNPPHVKQLPDCPWSGRNDSVLKQNVTGIKSTLSEGQTLYAGKLLPSSNNTGSICHPLQIDQILSSSTQINRHPGITMPPPTSRQQKSNLCDSWNWLSMTLYKGCCQVTPTVGTICQKRKSWPYSAKIAINCSSRSVTMYITLPRSLTAFHYAPRGS